MAPAQPLRPSRTSQRKIWVPEWYAMRTQQKLCPIDRGEGGDVGESAVHAWLKHAYVTRQHLARLSVKPKPGIVGDAMAAPGQDIQLAWSCITARRIQMRRALNYQVGLGRPEPQKTSPEPVTTPGDAAARTSLPAACLGRRAPPALGSTHSGQQRQSPRVRHCRDQSCGRKRPRRASRERHKRPARTSIFSLHYLNSNLAPRYYGPVPGAGR
jgi:hypothetical protein